LIDRSIEGTSLDGVYTDDSHALFELVNLLIQNGHRHIEYLTGQQTSAGTMRLSGFLKAFQRNGITCSEEWIHNCSFSKREGYHIVREILSRPRKQWPTAIVASNNMLSLGALRAIIEFDLQIPRDIAFCAYDQLELAEYLNCKITLVEKDNAEIGRLATQMLFERIDGTAIQQKRSIILQPHIVIRGSEKFPQIVS
jgi:LacI family transcriptional regulator